MEMRLSRLGTAVRRETVDTRGITLIELLVVLAIIGLLAVVVAPRALDLLSRAKSETAKIQIERLASVLDLYRLDAGRYPTQQEGLRALVERPSTNEKWNGPYVTEASSLNDPWGRPYLYRQPGEHGDYDLMSLGADATEGGDGDDGDITNWSR